MIGSHLFPQQKSDVNPRLIIANHIIQLTALEIEQAIVQELDTNPALEMVERMVCPLCNGPLQAGYCRQCNRTGAEEEESHSFIGYSLSEAAKHGDEPFDPLAAVPAPLSLPEQLFAQLRLFVDKKDHEIAFHLVGNLDEHGYLAISIEELVQSLHVDATRIFPVLHELQQLDPAGVGARDLRECLLLQTERLNALGSAPPAATRAIIQNHLAELGHHQFERIRSMLNISREEVEEAFLFIRTNLHPYPAYHYYRFHPEGEASSPASPPLIPSVYIYQSTTAACGYEVEVIESRRFLVRLNPLYQQLRQTPDLAFSQGEREHVAHYLERARFFMHQLQQRTTLLKKVATYLVHHQRDFLEYGPSHLRPLIQRAVSQALHVHVSTISRAVSNKFALLPSRELIPLSRFFFADLEAPGLIRQFIAQETTPLSDESVAKKLLHEHGITLSRQMVAKYRTDLGIPAARQRTILRRSGGKSYDS